MSGFGSGTDSASPIRRIHPADVDTPSLSPDARTRGRGGSAQSDPVPTQPTIAEIAADDDTFSTLVAALTAADLVDTFADADAGPFTVFAPTNAAFEAFVDGVEDFELEDLLALESLADILGYHVTAGVETAASY